MVAFSRLVLFFLLMLLINSSAAKPYGATICHEADNTCYVVKRADTWSSLFPDEKQRNIVKRLNRINIPLERGMKIAIPNDLDSLTTLDISPFAKQINPPGEKIILVSLKELAWGAYDGDGELQHWGPVSGGKDWCPDIRRSCRTKLGEYKIYQKGTQGCRSTKYPIPRGGAPMPYCMFFHGGFALHGSATVPGYNDSHGCVRMFTEDAKWLNQYFLDNTDNTPIIVFK